MKFKEFLIRHPLLPAFVFAGACAAPYGFAPIIPAFIAAFISDRFIGPKENASRIAVALLAMAVVLCPEIATWGQIVAACLIIIAAVLASPRRIKLGKWMRTTILAIEGAWYIGIFVISCAR